MAATLQRILCVEDDPDIQAITQLALEAIGGFEVVICQNGYEALAKIEEFAADLILLDVMMPELDGPSTLAELRKNPKTYRTPVVFMTARAQPQEIIQLRDLGAIDVIPKPFDPLTLAPILQSLWNHAY